MSDDAAPATVTIRRAQPADADTVVSLLLELAAHEGDASEARVTADHWREQLTDPQVVVFVASIAGVPAGCVCATRRRYPWGGWLLGLNDLYVREQARNRGIGEQLMGRMATHAGSEQVTIRWELEGKHYGGQRSSTRLGPALRPKKVAAWMPARYTEHAERARPAS